MVGRYSSTETLNEDLRNVSNVFHMVSLKLLKTDKNQH